MGRLAAGSRSLGEVALLFSMTRPVSASKTVPFEGHAPWIVWVLLTVYTAAGVFFIGFEIRSCRRLIRRYRQAGASETARRPGEILKSSPTPTLPTVC